MVCDYYIYIYLEIEHFGGTFYYELPVRRGYYSEIGCGHYDADYDEVEGEYPLKEEYQRIYSEYQRIYSELINLELTPYPPIVIYENDAFISPFFEEKYRPLLEKQFQENALFNLRHENDPEYESENDSEYSAFYKRYENDGIPPESFDQVIKITRKEDRITPSCSWIHEKKNTTVDL